MFALTNELTQSHLLLDGVVRVSIGIASSFMRFSSEFTSKPPFSSWVSLINITLLLDRLPHESPPKKMLILRLISTGTLG
jgi:hypothetical protein